MGYMFIQHIYTCVVCGRTPEEGEVMYHTGTEVWCGKCVYAQNDKDTPEEEEEG